MFDHLSVGVTNLERSLAFYDTVFAPLGIKRSFNLPHVAAYGPEGRPMFWIGYKDEPFTNVTPSEGFHLAFQADNRKAVDEFYAAAISAGAKDDGKPGLRPHYHPNYYAAFVIDPDGYRIEAVCHKPE
jgi:catechol 2,3-dioxygenase-like lactoylglutathione lyase family enzyme